MDKTKVFDITLQIEVIEDEHGEWTLADAEEVVEECLTDCIQINKVNFVSAHLNTKKGGK